MKSKKLKKYKNYNIFLLKNDLSISVVSRVSFFDNFLFINNSSLQLKK